MPFLRERLLLWRDTRGLSSPGLEVLPDYPRYLLEVVIMRLSQSSEQLISLAVLLVLVSAGLLLLMNFAATL